MLKKNFLLFTWKNIHDWRRLSCAFLLHLGQRAAELAGGRFAGALQLRGHRARDAALPRRVASRSRARRLAVVSDTEAFRRPLGGHFRDTFGTLPTAPDPLRVLFVSPYPICPPVHGGGVFMYQTVHELARLCELHLIVLLDFASTSARRIDELDRICASTEYLVRPRVTPESARRRSSRTRSANSAIADLAWLIHRQIYTQQIDVLQLEYTVLGQYAGQFRHIPSILFEHDVYFQSIARRLPFMTDLIEKIAGPLGISARAALRTAHAAAARSHSGLQPRQRRLSALLPAAAERAASTTDIARESTPRDIPFAADGREPFTILFLGSFRHTPESGSAALVRRAVFCR